MTTQRFTVDSLKHLAETLFTAAGMDKDKAQSVAEVLVTGDMVGQRTRLRTAGSPQAAARSRAKAGSGLAPRAASAPRSADHVPA